MKELAEYMVKAVVNYPEKVLLTLKEDNQTATILMELRVDSTDFPRVIGKSGNTIKAIRTLLNAAGFAHRKRVQLEVLK